MTISLFEDFKVRELFPVKVLLFLQSAGDMALYPFFTLHMKSLGINLTDIGIQFAVTPFATLIATPLVGLLADKVGNFRHILSMSLLICSLIAASILFVPKVQKVPECVQLDQPLYMGCPTGGSSPDRYLNITLPKCLKQRPQSSTKPSVPITSQPLELLVLTGCRVQCDNNRGQLCLYLEPDGNYCFNLNEGPSPLSSSSFINEPLTIKLSPDSDKLLSSNGQSMEALLHTVSHNSKTYLDLTCRSNSSCYVLCPLTEENSIPNHYQNMVIDPTSKVITFWLYLVLRIGLIVVIATEMSLLKAAVLTIVDKNRSEYGYQRLWASIANVFIPPLTGIAMDMIRARGNNDAFAPCFIVYCSFKVIMAVVTLFMRLDIKPPAVKIWSKVGQLVRNKEAAIFLLFVTFIGSTWGFIETFIAWYLEELNSSRFLMGMCSSVAAVSGVPFTIFAGSIERRIGHVNILIIGILVYAVRLVGYSFAPNAYYVLAFETLEGVTTTLVLITITTYASTLSTSDLLATMQATWAALHFSVGRALGSVTGGYLFAALGSRKAYQVWSFACLIAGIVYAIIYVVYVRGKELKRREAKKQDKIKEKATKKAEDVKKIETSLGKFNSAFRSD